MDPHRLKDDAVAIFRAALAAADPEAAVRRAFVPEGRAFSLVDGLPLDPGPRGRIWILGYGKASAPMAAALEDLVEPTGALAGGYVVVKEGHGAPTRRVRVVEAGHPRADARSAAAADAMLALAEAAAADDRIVVAVSGGGSALAASPAPGLSLADKIDAIDALMAAGAPIDELNTVRKHLSRFKGGRLAAATRARVVALILSDVIGDDPATIASGPTAPDPTTYADARAALDRRGVRPSPAVAAVLAAGLRGARPETPKPGDPAFARVRNLVVGSNRRSLAAAADEARARGYATEIATDALAGEARERGAEFAARARTIRAGRDPLAPPACVLAGGETTVTLRGPGRGGRSQEMAAAFAVGAAGLSSTAFLAAGTDGTDGPTDAAGAVVDGATAAGGPGGIDGARAALARSDTYPWLEAAGSLLKTGPTRTNVMDVDVLLVGAA